VARLRVSCSNSGGGTSPRPLCSRATAYRAVADAFADGTLAKAENEGA
jgi:hypothetical protein